MICKNCKKNIKETGLKLVETNAEIIYDVSLDPQGELQWEQSHIESGNGDLVVYCCANCGAELGYFEEDEVKKMLKGQK
jgi:hypothetical protein